MKKAILSKKKTALNIISKFPWGKRFTGKAADDRVNEIISQYISDYDSLSVCKLDDDKIDLLPDDEVKKFIISLNNIIQSFQIDNSYKSTDDYTRIVPYFGLRNVSAMEQMESNSIRDILKCFIKFIKNNDLIDNYINYIYARYDNDINSIDDRYKGDIKELTGNTKSPSKLFKLLLSSLGHVFNYDGDTCISKKEVRKRKPVNVIVKLLGPLFLSNPQILIENRQEILTDKDCDEYGKPYQNIAKAPEDSIHGFKVKNGKLKKKPVAYVSNHGFKDDLLATILKIKRLAYLVIASIPQILNTIDGVLLYLHGPIGINRNDPESRRSVEPKTDQAFKIDLSIYICPEGVWNKTPNKLILNLWRGIYKIAKKDNIPVVPVIHYLRDPLTKSKDNPIYTVFDDPMFPNDYKNEEDFLEALRNRMASWKYRMMDKYGRVKVDNGEVENPTKENIQMESRAKLLNEVGNSAENHKEERLRKDKQFKSDYTKYAKMIQKKDIDIWNTLQEEHKEMYKSRYRAKLSDPDIAYKLAIKYINGFKDTHLRYMLSSKDLISLLMDPDVLVKLVVHPRSNINFADSECDDPVTDFLRYRFEKTQEDIRNKLLDSNLLPKLFEILRGVRIDEDVTFSQVYWKVIKNIDDVSVKQKLKSSEIQTEIISMMFEYKKYLNAYMNRSWYFNEKWLASRGEEELKKLFIMLRSQEIPFDMCGCVAEYENIMAIKYGHQSFDDAVKSASRVSNRESSSVVWEKHLEEMGSIPDGYYSKIETTADLSLATEPSDVYNDFVNAPMTEANKRHLLHAIAYDFNEKRNRFQRRF